VNDCADGKAVLWSAKEEPLYEQNFWGVTGEWILIALEPDYGNH
jgi:hypothetical protein